MLRFLGRSAQLLRRASGSAVIFGAGYGLCWAQDREESADKLLVWGGAASVACTLRFLRYLRHALPEGAEWPEEQLQQVERLELQWLCRIVEQCQDKGLDSPILQQLLLFTLCEHAQADPCGLAVQGLQDLFDEDVNPRPLPQELAFRIHDAAKGSESIDSLPPSHLLPILSSALVSLLTVPDTKKMREDLGEGTGQVAETAAIATCWMAFDVSRPCQARYGLKPEEISQVSEELSNAWKVLGKSSAAGGFRPSNEWRRLQARLEGLKDQLPRDLRNSVEAFVSKGSVRSSGKVGTAVDYLSWAVLAIFLLALSSEDGIGLLRFHVVPEAWQSVVKDMLQQRALKVEELLARHDRPQVEVESPRIGWEAPAEYLQVQEGPLFRGNGPA
mmetsp:Transcript_1756/g.3082  ORF Transcript_1756/g.3082 Transcript_1756/m.3082 type:complete len:388 (+) Transcript_1756:30-1193(+)